MEIRHAALQRITDRLSSENCMPVIFGSVEGEYTLAELHAMEAELQQHPIVRAVTLGRTAEALTYMVDTRHSMDTVSDLLAS